MSTKAVENHRYTPRILNAAESSGGDQKKVIAEKVTERFGDDLNGFTFAVWDLSFKPETDDMRVVAIKAYDPKAMEEAA